MSSSKTARGPLERMLRFGESRRLRQYHRVVIAVGDVEQELREETDEGLQERSRQLRSRVESGATLEDIQVEAFALVREAAWRVLGQRPYDVQVFGAAVLHAGQIAEMKTGEGKTLTSAMAVYLNALSGRGVHVVTVNEYLARRDAEWMGRIHQFLGLSVGVVISGDDEAGKRAAYACDITYGTNNEFGFDYLRDNMSLERAHQIQRGHAFALVDEVDSILIDEARTPLIISGVGEQSADLYQTFARKVVPNLTRGRDGTQLGEEDGDYTVDEAKRTVSITEQGVSKVEQLLGVDNMYESANTPLIHHLQNALKARDLYRRDREYVVIDGEVQIVDDNTGRILAGRRYSEGLHQAIEAKEGVQVKDENKTLATVTLQNYYRTYEKLAGMTGTALTEESEFLEIYQLGVVEVPTNREVVRVDHGDVIYKSEKAKFAAVVEEIVRLHEQGQPVLVGTTSVEKSEKLSDLLRRRGVSHEMLNAKNHAREADIVAQAGRLGAVTVATNMAGRGTDIILGGNAEQHALREAAELGPEASAEERSAAARDAYLRYASDFAVEGDRVRALGGLFVIGTERHESRRIDNQLRGRSGRQGDPGSTRFYLSLEDDLMRLFNASAVERIMDRLNMPEETPIEASLVTKAVANAQRQVESINFDRRKQILKYDDVLNEQRRIVYQQRQQLLESEDALLGDLGQRYIKDFVVRAVDMHCPEGTLPEDWDLNGLARQLAALHDGGEDLTEIDLERADREGLTLKAYDALLASYALRIQEAGGVDRMRRLEQRIILEVMDRNWREHLYEMDALRDGIGLRAVGQRDPLVEYQREAHASFTAMMTAVKDESVGFMMRMPLSEGVTNGTVSPSPAEPEAAQSRSRPVAGAGRNSPCPCGSGLKYKRCHGK